MKAFAYRTCAMMLSFLMILCAISTYVSFEASAGQTLLVTYIFTGDEADKAGFA